MVQGVLADTCQNTGNLLEELERQLAASRALKSLRSLLAQRTIMNRNDEDAFEDEDEDEDRDEDGGDYFGSIIQADAASFTSQGLAPQLNELPSSPASKASSPSTRGKRPTPSAPSSSTGMSTVQSIRKSMHSNYVFGQPPPGAPGMQDPPLGPRPAQR